MASRLEGIRVSQWLEGWNDIEWDASALRREPQHEFYLFSVKASSLKRLSGIYRRNATSGERRIHDTGIQRSHDSKRSKKIKEFVKYGYPYCELTDYQKESGEHSSLRKPGWLPTGIVINVLTEDDERKSKRVAQDDLLKLSYNADSKVVELELPDDFDERWRPETIPPIEVIDGQHRLWAFDDEFAADYEMPVIAFYGLDISWQAYLFWSINITPVRINRSLAFDMYPLLRAEDWVDKAGHKVYLEARAQELVETLWSHNKSPWKNKINMLAVPKNPYIRQATWIRALLNTLVKNTGKSSRIGGLFGVSSHDGSAILPWSRTQQAAFIIFFGSQLLREVSRSTDEWVECLRANKTSDLEAGFEPGMFDKRTLLNTDQGIRALFLLLNEICVVNLDEHDYYDWEPSDESGAYSEEGVEREIEEIGNYRFSEVISQLAEVLAKFDWRTSAAPGLSEEQVMAKKALRGSGGYAELRSALLDHCLKNAEGVLLRAVVSVAEVNGHYE